MKRWLLGASLLLGSGCGVSSCVARGSRVRTPRGEAPIETVGLGDEVICVDPTSGAQHVARVSMVRSARRECVSLSFAGRSLRMTSDHPVYCPDRRLYAPAGDWVTGVSRRLLRVGDEGVEAVEVTASAAYDGVDEVFDLTIEHALHNFVVEGVLVHNKQPNFAKCRDDAGTQVTQFDDCSCPDGSLSIVVCEHDGARCDCPDDAGTP